MASELPLLLYEIGYEDINWVYSPTALATLGQQWEDERIPHTLFATM